MAIDAEVIKLRAVHQLQIVTAWGWKRAWGEHCTFSGRQTDRPVFMYSDVRMPLATEGKM